MLVPAHGDDAAAADSLTIERAKSRSLLQKLVRLTGERYDVALGIEALARALDGGDCGDAIGGGLDDPRTSDAGFTTPASPVGDSLAVRLASLAERAARLVSAAAEARAEAASERAARLAAEAAPHSAATGSIFPPQTENRQWHLQSPCGMAQQPHMWTSAGHPQPGFARPPIQPDQKHGLRLNQGEATGALPTEASTPRSLGTASPGRSVRFAQMPSGVGGGGAVAGTDPTRCD